MCGSRKAPGPGSRFSRALSSAARVAGKDLGCAGPAPSAGPPARVRRVPFWRELAFLLVLAAMLTVLTRAFAVEAFRIPSGSMADTLRAGDRVLVNKLVYRIRGI